MPAYTAKVAIRRVAVPPGKEEKSRPPNNGRLAGHSNPCTASARPPHLLPAFYTPALPQRDRSTFCRCSIPLHCLSEAAAPSAGVLYPCTASARPPHLLPAFYTPALPQRGRSTFCRCSVPLHCLNEAAAPSAGVLYPLCCVLLSRIPLGYLCSAAPTSNIPLPFR
jgi:hypothetical protein